MIGIYYIIKVNKKLVGEDPVSGYICWFQNSLVDIFEATCFENPEEAMNYVTQQYNSEQKDSESINTIYSIELIYK